MQTWESEIVYKVMVSFPQIYPVFESRRHTALKESFRHLNYGVLDYFPVPKRVSEYLDMDLGIMLRWGSDSFPSLSYIEMKLKNKYKMRFILLLKS